MANRTYDIDVNVGTGNSLKSVTELKTELQRLESEFETLPVGSAEFNRLGNSIKQVRSQLKDVELQFEGLDKEQRATALVDTFNGLTGAVGAVSSAFIAFGASSEAVENAEKKLLGVLGVVGGLRDVSNSLVAANKLLGPTIAQAFTTATGAINVTRVALAGLGIGLVIALVVKLADAFDLFGTKAKESADKAEKSLEQYAKRVQLIADINETAFNKEIKQAQLAGKTDEEVNALRLKLLKERVAGIQQEGAKLTLAQQKERAELVKIEKVYLQQIDALEVDAAKRAEAKRKENAAKRLANQKDARAKELEAEKTYVEALGQLGEAQAKDEDERITIQFENRITALKEAERKELAQTNLTEAAKKLIRDKYILLRELADEEATKSREALQKAALDREVARTEEAFQKITDASNQSIAELNTFYDEVLAQFQNIDVNFLRKLFETSDPREFFSKAIDDIIADYQRLADKEKELAINSEENIKESERRKLEAIRKTALDQIVLIEKAQKDQIKVFDEQLKNNKLTTDERQALEDKLNEIIKQGQIRKKQITEQAAKDEVAITNNTAEQIEQRRLSLNQFVTSSVQSLFDSLRTLNQAAGDADEADKRAAFERDKQFATAEAIITGLLAVQRIFSNAAANPKSVLFPAQPYIEAALAGISAIARVKQIQSTTFESATAANNPGGGSTGTAGGSIFPSPFAGQGAGGTNILPPRIAPPGGGAGGQTAGGGPDQTFAGGQLPVIRTYVLAGDVTDAQTVNEKLKNNRVL